MDAWQIVLYVIGIIFNIGAVAAVREKGYQKCNEFLQSGRLAVVLVFLLCFLELLVTGKFEAFKDADKLIALLQQASTMTMATVGTHAVGKTAIIKK